MAFDAGAIVGRMRLNMTEWQSSVRRVTEDTSKIRGNVKNMAADVRSRFKSIGDGIVNARQELLGFGTAVLGAAALSVKAAGDATEANNLFEVSFGDMKESVRAWADEQARILDLSAGRLRAQAAGFNLMIKNMGIAKEAAADMSKQLSLLAIDISSLRNISIEEAIDKLRSGITGESEPLKALGIVVNETATKQALLRHEIEGVGKTLTEQQKVLGRYLAIMDQTTADQGDWLRTNDELNNSVKRLQDQVHELRVALGGALVPATNKFVNIAEDAAEKVTDWTNNNKELANVVIPVAAGIGAVSLALGGLGFVLPKISAGLTGIATAFGISRLAVLGWGGAIVGVAALVIANWDDVQISALKVVQGIGNAFAWLLNASANVLDDLTNDLSTAVAFMAEGVAKIIDFFGKIPLHVQRSLRQMSNAIRAFVADSLEQLATLAEGFSQLPIIGGAASGSASAIRGLASSIREAAGVANLEIGILNERIESGAIGNAMATGRDWLNNFAQGIRDQSRSGVDSNPLSGTLRGWADQATQVAAGAGEEASKAFEESFDSSTSQAADATNAATSAASSAVENIANATGEAMENVSKSGKSANKELTEAEKKLEQMKEHALDMRQSIFPKEAMQESIANLQELHDKFPDIIDNEALAKGIADIWNQYSEQGVVGFEDVEAVLDRLDPKVREMLNVERAEQFKDSVQGIGDAFESSMAAADMDRVNDDIHEAETRARSVKEEFQNIVSELQNVGANISNIGRNIGSDLVANMGAVINSVGNIAKGVMQSITAFRSLANIAKLTGTQIALAMAQATAGVTLVVAAIVEAASAFGLFGDKGEEELKGIDKLFDELGKKVEEWGEEFTDMLVDFLKTGEASFKEFVDSVLEDILRLTIQTTITDPIVGAIQGAFSKGAAFDKGNVVAFAGGGVVATPTVFPMSGGKTGVMGEAGPEAIMPLKRMSDGGLGVQTAGGSGGNVNIQVIDQRSGGAPVSVEESRGPRGARQIRVLVRDAFEEMAAKGDLDKVLNNFFGVRRRPR